MWSSLTSRLRQGSNAGWGIVPHARVTCAGQVLMSHGLTCGDVAHLLCLACLLNCGHAVTTTDDGDAALGGQLSQQVSNGLQGGGVGDSVLLLVGQTVCR